MRKSQVVAASAAVLVAAGSVVAFSGHGAVDVGVARLGRSPRTTIGPSVQAAAGASSASFGVAADTAGAAVSSGPAIAPAEARVVKTASLELSVRTNALVTQATSEANHIAEASGGFVASSDSSKGKSRQTTLTLRVPAASYDDALRGLRRLGKVTDESLGGKDVTGTLVDLDARLRSLRAQEEAYNALLAKARTVGETLQVAQAASEVRIQIEQLAAQQQQLADQADFATIKLHIAGPNVALDSSAPRSDPLLVASVKDAVAGTLAVFGGVIVVVGYVLPLGALAALGYGVWRVVNRKRDTEVAVAS